MTSSPKPAARRAARARWFTFLPVLVCIGTLLFAGATDAVRPVSSPQLNACLLVLSLIGLAFSLRAATHPGLDRAARRPWRLIAVTIVLQIVCGAAFGFASRHGTLPGLTDPAMLVGVTAKFAIIPVSLAALLSFGLTPLSRRSAWKLAFDVATVVGGGLMLAWYFLIGPALTSTEQAATGSHRFLSLVNPIGAVVLLLGLVTVLMRGAVAASRRPLLVLMAALSGYLVEGVLVTRIAIFDPDGIDSPWLFTTALVAATLIAAAAAEQCVVAAEPAGPDRAVRLRPALWLPYPSLMIGFAVLAVAAGRNGLYPWVGLVAAAVVMTAGVTARQVVALRENHAMVITDSLTGLANRLRVRDELSRTLDRSRRSGVPAGVLLVDLDGFKQVNDTYGHEAGDAMLIAFADVLRGAVRGGDTPARLGGDEFAVVLDAVGSAAEAVRVVERILAAAAEPVQLGPAVVPIELSVGIALAADDTESVLDVHPQELLHRADMAMYVAKRRGNHSYQLYTDAAAEADLDSAQQHRGPSLPTAAARAEQPVSADA